MSRYQEHTRYEALYDVPHELTGRLFLDVRVLAQGVRKALDADGSIVAVNTRISQSVRHRHVHIVPRWQGDGLISPRLVRKRRPYRDDSEAEETREAIPAAAAKLRD